MSWASSAFLLVARPLVAYNASAADASVAACVSSAASKTVCGTEHQAADAVLGSPLTAQPVQQQQQQQQSKASAAARPVIRKSECL
jgi:hypothetical protein